MTGRAFSAIVLCTNTVSMALQTEGRDVFALKIISAAIATSADSSTYTWQLPEPVSITGTFAFSTTALIKPAPPLGINTSKYSVKRIISFADSLLVFCTSWTQFPDKPTCSNAACIMLVIHWLEWNASFPPRKMTALPDFKQSAAASEVTFGLAS